MSDLEALLKRDGWTKQSMGIYRSSGSTASYDRSFALYVKREKLEQVLCRRDADYLKKCATTKSEKCEDNSEINMGSISTGGCLSNEMTPKGSSSLPSLAKFDLFPSLQAIRSDRPSIVIGFDSEWYGQPRHMVSWQFSTIHDGELLRYVVLPLTEKRLNAELVLARILDDLGVDNYDARKLRRFYACPSFDDDGKPNIRGYATEAEARRHAKYIFRNSGFVQELISEQHDADIPERYRSWKSIYSHLDFSSVPRISVTIVCHAGKADISTLDQTGQYHKDLLKYCSDVQGGLITLKPIKMNFKSVDPHYKSFSRFYSIVLSIDDTMCQAQAGKKSLLSLGAVINYPKIEIPQTMKENMDLLLKRDPVLFFQYASTDSDVALLYSAALYDYNKQMAVTITSATARVMKLKMQEYLGVSSTEEFNHVYRGLHTVEHGKVPRDDRPGYVESTSLEPITDEANTIQYYASQAFHGGYNSCSEVGYFNVPTFDYDLQNAYPTAMVLIPDINWDNPIRSRINNRDLRIEDWRIKGSLYDPVAPFVGYIRFSFPKSVRYPCIPVCVDGIPIFPHTSDGIHGVYACGPEIFLALKLGASVYCEQGFFLNTLSRDTGEESYSLRYAVKQLVTDRKKAKAVCGSKSLEELILKTMVNSGYGKNAQNVVQKHTWSAYSREMVDLGCSAITNPVSACLITSIVRAELLAAQNQVQAAGYKSVSVTTDGFISTIPESLLKSLDLYGIRPIMEVARLFLTDNADAELWEIKHIQDDLLNFCTRGNVSLHDGDDVDAGYQSKNPYIFEGKKRVGVCAHAGVHSPYDSDTLDDRKWLMLSVLQRTGRVSYVRNEWTSFKDLAKGADLVVSKQTINVRMDYDCKRKPIRESMIDDAIVIENYSYTIAHFDTEPYQNVEEFRLYRQKRELCEVLRTLKDWEKFWLKIDTSDSRAKVRDLAWSKLTSCVSGHRSGQWVIPGLNYGSVQDKCDFINRHNHSSRQFKINDWKNSRRPERVSTMLPKNIIEDLLNELINADDYKKSDK